MRPRRRRRRWPPRRCSRRVRLRRARCRALLPPYQRQVCRIRRCSWGRAIDLTDMLSPGLCRCERASCRRAISISRSARRPIAWGRPGRGRWRARRGRRRSSVRAISCCSTGEEGSSAGADYWCRPVQRSDAWPTEGYKLHDGRMVPPESIRGLAWQNPVGPCAESCPARYDAAEMRRRARCTRAVAAAAAQTTAIVPYTPPNTAIAPYGPGTALAPTQADVEASDSVESALAATGVGPVDEVPAGVTEPVESVGPEFADGMPISAGVPDSSKPSEGWPSPEEERFVSGDGGAWVPPASEPPATAAAGGGGAPPTAEGMPFGEEPDDWTPPEGMRSAGEPLPSMDEVPPIASDRTPPGFEAEQVGPGVVDGGIPCDGDESHEGAAGRDGLQPGRDQCDDAFAGLGHHQWRFWYRRCGKCSWCGCDGWWSWCGWWWAGGGGGWWRWWSWRCLGWVGLALVYLVVVRLVQSGGLGLPVGLAGLLVRWAQGRSRGISGDLPGR